VRHLDGNPKNNSARNLAYGSASENVLDGYAYRGSIRRGQKLTEQDAAEIKKMLAKGTRSRDLAKEYGVSEQSICDIKHGRIYRRVQP
jgi:DNA invertase Pin-like site-specific DNA recombinase